MTNEDPCSCYDALVRRLHQRIAITTAGSPLQADLCEATSAIEKLIESFTKHCWIPVTERLPEAERKSYWVCTDTGYQCECRWTNNRFGIRESDKWGWSIFDIPQHQKVVAWMPLPRPYEPPKEEDDDEFEKMAVVLEEHNRICDACKFQHEGCSGGVHGGPNGPIYPPCTDGKANEYLDKKLLAIVYEELQKEKEEDI